MDSSADDSGDDAAERSPPGESADQSTKKISASELAAVPARADGSKRPKNEEPPPAPPHTLAVVERPVAERKVVNVTSPDVRSSGKLLAAEEHRPSTPDVEAAAPAPAPALTEPT